MKLLRWIALVCSALPLTAYALFCPTNGKFVELGDTSKNIIRVCGKPSRIKTIDNSIIISAVWTYIKNTEEMSTTSNLTFDKGYLIKMTQSISCATDDGSCFPKSDEILYIFNDCDQEIYVGSSIPWVEKNCPPPAKKETLDADYHVVDEYYYDNTSQPSTLIFENNLLVDSK